MLGQLPTCRLLIKGGATNTTPGDNLVAETTLHWGVLLLRKYLGECLYCKA